MKAHELKNERSDKNRKRVGRGISAGGGKTAGRGTKGQNSRSGHNIPRKFEGGQTPLAMRTHKLPGFKSLRNKAVLVTFSDINKKFTNGEVVSMNSLVEKGIIKKGDRAKIVNTGEIKVSVSVSDVAISKGAKEIVEKFSAKKTEKEKVVKPTDKPKNEK